MSLRHQAVTFTGMSCLVTSACAHDQCQQLSVPVSTRLSYSNFQQLLQETESSSMLHRSTWSWFAMEAAVKKSRRGIQDQAQSSAAIGLNGGNA
mmetsp:Transcript_4832/g.8627  ORF Transcript_4832/g.8627 Transcript_4832/m.8627 type:complete len:94 (-) Transcript_4832:1435-1716(-)